MSETGSTRLIVVDDDDTVLQALCATLCEQGYEARGYSNGPAALRALDTQSFDVLLTDLTMPGMDGIAVLREAQRRDPLLVGILLTGAGSIATAVEAMRAGAFDYIQKPFKLAAVLPVISRALAVRQLRLDKAMLEHAVRQRTLELERANSELEAFAYSVSHDLRSPLHAVIGGSDLLVHHTHPPLHGRAQALADGIHQSALRMNALIEDLLKLSQVSMQDLQWAEVDLSALAAEVMAPLQAAAPWRAVAVHIEPGLHVQGDAGLLRIALENLLGNAWKYTGRCARPCIELQSHAEAGTTVYTVRDNGAGFDMAQAQNLFKPFERLHQGTEFTGTGIGLSIVQRIVRRHGGRIWAEAQVDQGACFSFTLSGDGAPDAGLAMARPATSR